MDLNRALWSLCHLRAGNFSHSYGMLCQQGWISCHSFFLPDDPAEQSLPHLKMGWAGRFCKDAENLPQPSNSTSKAREKLCQRMTEVPPVGKYWLHKVQCRVQHLPGRFFFEEAFVFHNTSRICLPEDFINLLNQQDQVATLFYLI